jgi:hypothetical protein
MEVALYNGKLTDKRKDPQSTMQISTPARVGTLIGLIALCAYSVARMTRPPAAVPATASDTVFSAERAMHDVEAIAARPHAMGMPDHDRVRDYIVRRLEALGVRAQVQTTTGVGTRFQAAGRVQNILAWLPGSTSGGKGVLLAAHYDGVEAGPAAGDDASGCAALLETVRALKARRTPLAHDVFVLFSDGEEAGLIGAAAFVREHPWAKDVAFILNFDARGTKGRVYMFETGPGNRDAVSALRAAGDVSAGSVFTTLYRSLPNDTDLSELSLLNVPALNFAFADGVERYHTLHDDVAHLDSGSVQHLGAQMLAVTQKVANEDLPRPKTGDAVFFDMPLLGLIVYPIGLAIPLALVAFVLTVLVVRHHLKGVGIGVASMIVALVVCGGLAAMIHLRGAAMWSWTFALAVALAVVAVNLALYALGTRVSPDLHAGVLVFWLLLALVTSFTVPGASYLFTWPLLFTLIAARSGRWVPWWIAAGVTLLLLAGFAYAVAAIMLGVSGLGASVLAIFTTLIVWLIAPLMMRVAGGRRSSWPLPAAFAGAAIVSAAIGVGTTSPSAAEPIPTALVLAEPADSGRALLGSLFGLDAWTKSVLGPTTSNPPAWVSALRLSGAHFSENTYPRVDLAAPTATYIRDTVVDGARRVIVRVKAPPGAYALRVRPTGAPIIRLAIDARVVDTTRFRRKTSTWVYWAVPDSGAVFSIAIPPGSQIDLSLMSQTAGLPTILTIPPRPPDVVPAQTGDITAVYRSTRF